MAGKRGTEPPGHYELRDHPQIKGLIGIYWHPDRGPADARPFITIGPGAIPLLAEALADWELNHHEVPQPRQEAGPGLRAVTDDGEI
jgi:hypothetical protein